MPGSGLLMRTAFLDVGSNSAHLDVLDLAAGGPLHRVVTVKEPTRLGESLNGDGSLGDGAIRRLTAAVGRALAVARRADAQDVIAFATSAIRDADNRVAIVSEVEEATGIRLAFLSGADEARMTFLAVRGWYGWSAGPILLADIGGGSLELAAGVASEPDTALSLPLGAGRLTRDLVPGDPPRRKDIKRLRRHLLSELENGAGELDEWLAAAGSADHAPVRTVATSKTFKQLAKLAGDTWHGERVLRRKALGKQLRRLERKTIKERGRLRGVSQSHARQILAGAVVAQSVMDRLDITRLEICPWALREGIALRRLQQLAVPGEHTDDVAHLAQPLDRHLPVPARPSGPPPLRRP